MAPEVLPTSVFPFMELSSEVQIMVIKKYYAGWKLTIIELDVESDTGIEVDSNNDDDTIPDLDTDNTSERNDDRRTNQVNNNNPQYPSQIDLQQAPATPTGRILGLKTALMLTCHYIHDISKPIRYQSFSGILKSYRMSHIFQTPRLRLFWPHLHTIEIDVGELGLPSGAWVRFQNFPALQKIRYIDYELMSTAWDQFVARGMVETGDEDSDNEDNEKDFWEDFMDGTLDHEITTGLVYLARSRFPMDWKQYPDKHETFCVEIRHVLPRRLLNLANHNCVAKDEFIAWVNVELRRDKNKAKIEGEVIARAVYEPFGRCNWWEKIPSTPVGDKWIEKLDESWRWPWNLGATSIPAHRERECDDDDPEGDPFTDGKPHGSIMKYLHRDFPTDLAWVDRRVLCPDRTICDRTYDPDLELMRDERPRWSS